MGLISRTMADYSFAVWMVLSGGLLLLFIYAAVVNLRRQHYAEIDLSDIVPYLLPVDVQALADALSVSQDTYLRHSQSAQEFHKLQRKRARLAAEYLRRMSHNAALLQQVGYGQLHSPNRMVAEQAQELIDAGVHVRLYTFLGLAALFFRRVWGFRWIAEVKISQVHKLSSAALIPAYQSLRSRAEELANLRYSTFHDALLQSL